MRFSKSFAVSIAALAIAAGATPAFAEAGDTLIRVRGIVVAPNEKSGGITPTFPTEEVSVNNAITPEVDITKMLSKNVGVELIAATTKHSFSGTSGTTGGIGKLGSTWVLPPTLTVQYHLAPDAKVRPYVGAGLNYTMFYSDKASSGLEAAVGSTSVHLKDSFGWAAQAGIDIQLNEKMFLNLDVKYIDIDTTARLTTTAIGTQRVKVNLDPLVFGIGVGFKL
ncbi:OmpW/AlkL family protein [Sphingorhabdus sp.]|jgi:outer membrane protein|uniref:OmpW/AlkL family protein n=2 Tax=Sphingorhabdus sp. TaxID=1902408 RepID=UPI003BAFDC1C|nr:OmpW family protein [Sphingomonadales bacterium]MBK9430991.1 OmpW family protein [Sphingomonadales bacterium]MBL0021133.1 OmpW family protein [Sphingomonadales bacterium]